MDLLTVKEAAKMLGITDRAVQKRILKGHLTAERIGARLWLITPAEVERQRSLNLKPGRQPHPPVD